MYYTYIHMIDQNHINTHVHIYIYYIYIYIYIYICIHIFYDRNKEYIAFPLIANIPFYGRCSGKAGIHSLWWRCVLWIQTNTSWIFKPRAYHYNDVIMSPMASQITNLTIVYSHVYLGTDQSHAHQSSVSLVFLWEFSGDRWIPHTKNQ